MQCINLEARIMSFDFNNNIGQFKAHSAYKDGSGMGGGGMYFQQGKKRKDQPDDDLFQMSDDSSENEITFDSDIKEKDISQDTFFNKFVNWFRINKD